MAATHAYIDQLLNKAGTFWPDFEAFQARIADFAVVNTLAQVLLKFTTPGIPDVYQGCELHDLSLVDPDNRRSVDYTQRVQLLADLVTAEHTQPTALWANRLSGQAKFWLTHKLLTTRRDNPEFWAGADYVPVAVEGTYREHILAFARQQGDTRYVVVVPLHLARLCREAGISDLLAINWQDTRIALPAEGEWTDLLFGRRGNSSMVTDLFANALPLAFLRLS
jgi:(1->4)-alpha-D-glucan 1-alpha-D-glucosylmutase